MTTAVEDDGGHASRASEHHERSVHKCDGQWSTAQLRRPGHGIPPAAREGHGVRPEIHASNDAGLARVRPPKEPWRHARSMSDLDTDPRATGDLPLRGLQETHQHSGNDTTHRCVIRAHPTAAPRPSERNRALAQPSLSYSTDGSRFSTSIRRLAGVTRATSVSTSGPCSDRYRRVASAIKA
jgi:hypothetical protein